MGELISKAAAGEVSAARPARLWPTAALFLALAACRSGQPAPPVADDAEPPAVAIVSPSSAAQFSTSVGEIALTGTASDNVGLKLVQWSSDRGGSGTATGSANWTTALIPLASGANVLTVTAEDMSGNRRSATITVMRTAADSALDLPRVPWEGGPAYYAQFPQAQRRGWTDPSFFPIAVWGATVNSQSDIDLDKEIGLNTYFELYGDPDFALIRANGMSAIHGKVGAAVGDETVAWLLADEPEQFGQGPGEVLNYLKTQAARFPANDGRMRQTNFTGNMIFPNYTPGDAIAASWLDLNDVVSLDIYWYARDLVCSGSISGEIWKDGSGSPQPHGSGYNNLSEAECHRSSNYGFQVDAQRRLAGLNGRPKPVWTFVENGDVFEGSDHHQITPDQIAGAVWNSLIHEARGVAYFNNSFNGCISSNNFRYPVRYGPSCYAEMRARVKVVNAQIRELAPVLNTQSYVWTFNPRLDTMLKASGGAYYVFAMPSGIKGGSAVGTHTLQLPSGIRASSAEVLFEGRSVPIDADGRFTDSFRHEYSYHIYRIRP